MGGEIVDIQGNTISDDTATPETENCRFTEEEVKALKEELRSMGDSEAIKLVAMTIIAGQRLSGWACWLLDDLEDFTPLAKQAFNADILTKIVDPTTSKPVPFSVEGLIGIIEDRILPGIKAWAATQNEEIESNDE